MKPSAKELYLKPDSMDVSPDELKQRIKLLMNKLQLSKKEKELLSKENQNLQQELLQMQSHLRCMVSGFANTTLAFPMANELANSIAEFYKCECFDMFFDVLTQELNMKGIIYFFQATMHKCDKTIADYFAPTFKSIMETGCFNTIDGPINNVLKKSYQSNYKQIYGKCFQNIQALRNEVQRNLKITYDEQLDQFLQKLSEIMFNCFISDPQMIFDMQAIGQKVYFNQTKHDPIDGFIKNKEECIILLPPVYKGQEQMAKSLVISLSYQLDNM